MPKPDKHEILLRLDKLLIGIKAAREEANSIDANIRPAIGAALFRYLLG